VYVAGVKGLFCSQVHLEAAGPQEQCFKIPTYSMLLPHAVLWCCVVLQVTVEYSKEGGAVVPLCMRFKISTTFSRCAVLCCAGDC
jgi:hypothetical protein